MKMLRITGCSNSSFWYAEKVGDVVQLIGLDRDEWITREPAGFVNIVKHCDAEVVNVVAAEPEVAPLAEIRLDRNQKLTGFDNYRQVLEFEVISPSAPSEHAADSLKASVRSYIAQWLARNASDSRIR